MTGPAAHSSATCSAPTYVPRGRHALAGAIGSAGWPQRGGARPLGWGLRGCAWDPRQFDKLGVYETYAANLPQAYAVIDRLAGSSPLFSAFLDVRNAHAQRTHARSWP